MDLIRRLYAATLLIAVLSVPTIANASLVDNGIFTTDDVSGLDWLDLSITTRQVYSSVETLNPGWRYATNVEVINLFSILFDGYFDTDATLHLSDSDTGYIDQNTDILNFQALFGYTEDFREFTYGLFEDENQVLSLMGSKVPSIFINYSTIFSPDYINDQEAFRDMAHVHAGTYLVRTSVVPVPAAVYLFGSGLIGLIGIARRKKA